ncbi:MAG TPA: glycosyltransferase [Candidatus Saccharimonadales bacterium]|nr:glycosyltransferase [Candidatus Saccharimonadales bacterium]
MKVAIVHDWFIGGGAERVVEQLHKMYPQAPIYTSYCSPQWRQRLAGAEIITGYLQRWPFSKLRKFLPPLRAVWFSRLDLSDYDLVISSSGAEAKAVNVAAPAIHINYCHAPTHYYWSRYDEYLKNPGFGRLDWLARLGLKILLGPMRRWDFKAAQRPTYMIANSNYIKDQIKKYYGREATVIHPPVDTELFKLLNKSSIPREAFLIAGRQTPYKRFDLAVAACTKLNLPLTVIGDGPDRKKLLKLAGPSINFLGWVSDNDRIKHFQSAKAFIFAGLDDFGVVAVEALAAGTPVIAYQAGGSLDYIQPGQTGQFFSPQTVESLTAALKKFNPENYDHAQIQKSAAKFSAQEFQKGFSSFIKKCLA